MHSDVVCDKLKSTLDLGGVDGTQLTYLRNWLNAMDTYNEACHTGVALVAATEGLKNASLHFHAGRAAEALRGLIVEFGKAQQDVQIASGECLVPVPAPGSDLSRVMLASRIHARNAEREALVADELSHQRDVLVSGAVIRNTDGTFSVSGDTSVYDSFDEAYSVFMELK